MVKSSTTEPTQYSWRAVLLVGLTVMSVGISYVISILVANWIGPEGYQNYAVTIATIGLMSTIAEAGAGKLSLKFLPKSIIEEQWSHVAGYLRYSLIIVILISVLLGICIVTGEILHDGKFGNYPLGIGVLFLPIIALAGVSVDFVMANRAAIYGTLIARLIIPCSTLIALYLTHQFYQPTDLWAVVCFCFGSGIGLLSSCVVFYRTSSKEIFQTKPTYQYAIWLKECAYFSVNAFLVTSLFRISLLVIETLKVAEVEVGYFAAALETGTLVLLLAKSTDKLFQPEMSVIIEDNAWGYGEKVRRKRYGIIGTGCLIFLVIIFFKGKAILALFGPSYVGGYKALCCIAFGNCVWTLFSLAPAYLRFVGRDDLVISTTLASALSMTCLTAILSQWYGATGSGIAYAIVVSLTAIFFVFLVNRDINHKKETGID